MPMDIDSSGGVAYTLDVSIGQDKKVVPVLVDTGSADLWVSASPCDNCTKSGMINTGIITNDGCDLKSKTYGSGSVHGCLVPTDVAIGDYALKDYPLLAARDTEGFDGKYMSGIFGLAMNKISIDNHATPIDLMYSASLISTLEVGFYLTRQGDGSEIVFGNPHSDKHANHSKKVQLDKQGDGGLYRIRLDSFVSHDQPITGSNPKMQDIDVIIDTGTTNLLVTESMMSPMYAALGGLQQPDDCMFVAPCEGPDNPDAALALQFAGTVFPIKWQDLVLRPSTSKPDHCYLRTQRTPAENYILIGSAFLHNTYHVINAATGQVTFYGLN
ncbi:uncharacterized protein I206_106090 [Kwoniella pini CBS 10737]|uniref:Peptidase A1 domain-containing protein n=1 Tax=Kwoniella pini CBS 10737 TaxID=1296096 RepID=A0A1B9I110_9TREE|nr:uncharacterized protein I206_04914 [Kwoniella pini CBS 10737]OCF49226.1 hypothetical protein I206_04914 [Kwoniella pini CBS 10737]